MKIKIKTKFEQIWTFWNNVNISFKKRDKFHKHATLQFQI